ncbi:MAG: type II toxin-antitoxin system HigB family toxin [Bacteroidetes bacterium]|nr:type II toxin-antitoxin system HigB family toxin [Bacteroidota bacterium]
MRVVAKKILREFWRKHADCEQQLKSWYREAGKSAWRNANDVKKEYPSASVLPSNRVVFNIKGNKYRLVVRINFQYQMVWIRFIGTHEEYDRIDAKKI